MTHFHLMFFSAITPNYCAPSTQRTLPCILSALAKLRWTKCSPQDDLLLESDADASHGHGFVNRYAFGRAVYTWPSPLLEHCRDFYQLLPTILRSTKLMPASFSPGSSNILWVGACGTC